MSTVPAQTFSSGTDHGRHGRQGQGHLILVPSLPLHHLVGIVLAFVRSTQPRGINERIPTTRKRADSSGLSEIAPAAPEGSSAYTTPWRCPDSLYQKTSGSTTPSERSSSPIPPLIIVDRQNSFHKSARPNGQDRLLEPLAPRHLIEIVLAFVKSAQLPGVQTCNERIQSTGKSCIRVDRSPNISDIASVSPSPCNNARVELSNVTAQPTEPDAAPDNNSPCSSVDTSSQLNAPKSTSSVMQQSSGRQILQCSGNVIRGRRCKKRSTRTEILGVLWYCTDHNPYVRSR
ncbi:hypothetical protein BD410DRAFT_808790 [Rickenella mellea]|uniref:Uncharacterized protein n=1 Tax=Rickenella mellea TaxID=50990 RepID=A0A4Y7PKH4_9AGAM|nr:hypothetical protein BD410DRAFT_808790 [Rickenella mellea]